MKKIYKFDYDSMEAFAEFIVDTEIFTADHAKATLEFFTWKYDEEADPIDEVMKKYAMQAIRIATANNYNEIGVIEEFKDMEGFCRLDGSVGIKLTQVSYYEFDEDRMEVEIINIK